MTLLKGHKISILFSDETGGIYKSFDDAKYAIEMAVTGEAMGPHGNPAAPLKISEIDANNNPVRELHISANITFRGNN